MQSEEQSTSRILSILRELIETLVFTALIFFLVRTFLFENYRVIGRSMEPTLENDQFLVVNKLGYRLYEPQRGDIIVFHERADEDRKLIKRVIGLPGEVVEIRHGEVFVDNLPLDEPYLADPGTSSQSPTSIPEGHYFVLGDHRTNSSDSRSWGTLPEERILGKAWISYWPPSLWGIIPHETYGDGL